MARERELRAALVRAEELHGPESIEAGRALHDLATLLVTPVDLTDTDRGVDDPRLREADALYERALAIKRRALGHDDPEVAITLHNWARLCEATGDVERARSLWVAAETAVSGPYFEPDQGDDKRGDFS